MSVLEAEYFVERGHFLGKNGHINGRLVKERALNDPHILRNLVIQLCERTVEYSPSLIVGQKNAGARLAALVGAKIGVLSLQLNKPSVDTSVAPPRISLAPLHKERVVVVEDNVTTGRSIGQIKQSLSGYGADPVAVVTLFNSGQATAERLGVLNFEALLDPEITCWPADTCIPCADGTPRSLGMLATHRTNG